MSSSASVTALIERVGVAAVVSALSLLTLAMLSAACGPQPANTKPKPTGRTSFGFEKIDVTGVTPLWGSASVANFVVGGADASDNAQPSVFETDAASGKITSTALPDLNTGRFCHCALFDPNRKELLVVGGRDKSFADIHDAELIDVEHGTKSAIDANGAADHPVGCMAFFSQKADKGWVFGGLSSTAGQFSGDTYRYDPSTHTLTKLPTQQDGPLERYDAGIHLLDDGDVLMVGGMGGAFLGVKMLSDMWLFHADTETWTEIKPDNDTLPPGRRYPWTSLAPDESELIYGFGTDSGTGQHMLDDLWVFHFDDGKTGGKWFNQGVSGKPPARGFTYKWQGPTGTAGVLAFGIDSSMKTLTDAFVLQVPDSLAGEWH